jgi:hypothetical protein
MKAEHKIVFAKSAANEFRALPQDLKEKMKTDVLSDIEHQNVDVRRPNAWNPSCLT